VQIVPAGQSVDIINDDGILHNIHTWPKNNVPFNKAQPKFKKVMTELFEKPDVIKISCDVHSWMQGWVIVAVILISPFRTTRETFKIATCRPGLRSRILA